MEDFDALAAALDAGIADIRGCLILSRDGLVLGGHPDTAEQGLKAAWLRFAALGEPERGFVQFGTEIWSYARCGPYASFAVTGIAVRPGLVIDHMEQMLLAAESARSNGEGLKVAAPVRAQSAAAPPTSAKRKKRRALRVDRGPIEEPVVIHAGDPVASAASETGPSASDAAPDPPFEGTDPGTQAPFEDVDPGAGPSLGEHQEPAEADPVVGREASGDEDEVDRFSLAAEFSRLLQDERDDADG